MSTIIFIASLIYCGLVFGIFIKFSENGIRLSLKSQYITFIFPIIVVGLHSTFIFKMINERKKVPFKFIVLPIIKFPVVVGVIIELLLEKQAQAVANKTRAINKTRRESKRIKSIDNTRRSIGFDMGIFKDAAVLYESNLTRQQHVV